MNNLTDALISISEQLKGLVADGHNARLASVDVGPHLDEPGNLHAVLELEGGALLGATFHDADPWTNDRREELELTFAAAATMSAAMYEEAHHAPSA